MKREFRRWVRDLHADDYGSYALALIFIVTSVAQLVTIAEFISIITSYYLSIGDPGSRLLGATIVALEVFAVPFLLRMRPLSASIKLLSLLCGVLAALVWIGLGLWSELVSGNNLQASGLFGSLIKARPGWWLVGYGALLLALYFWVVIGRVSRNRRHSL